MYMCMYSTVRYNAFYCTIHTMYMNLCWVEVLETKQFVLSEFDLLSAYLTYMYTLRVHVFFVRILSSFLWSCKHDVYISQSNIV